MIPRVLQIKNFLSYSGQVQTIDFTPYSLICLSGRNGHGKSALLDAITWAVWGQARKSQGTSKPDEGIVRMGQTRAFVDFEFEMEGVIYRVRREYFKGQGKSVAGLEFQVKDAASDSFKTLTCKTIRETQERIEELLKLDFDTFLNTSFFRQGSSNEFSKKTPKERKQILANILGLEKYDQMCEAAQAESRALQETLAKVLAAQEMNFGQIEKIPALEAQLKEIETQGLALRKNLDQKRTDIQNLDSKLLAVEHFLKNIKEFEQKIIGLSSAAKVWRANHAEILACANPESLEAEKSKIKVQEKQLQIQQTKFLSFSTEFLSAANALREAKNKILREIHQQIEALNSLLVHKDLELAALEQSQQKIVVQQLKFEKQQGDLNLQFEQSAKIVEAWKKREADFFALQRLQTKLQGYKEFAAQRMLVCRDQMLSAKVSVETLSRANSDCAVCPTCSRSVDTALADRLCEKFSWRQEFFRHTGKNLKNLHEKVLLELTTLSESLDFLQAEQTAVKVQTLKLVDLQKQSQELSAEFLTVQQELEAHSVALKAMHVDRLALKKTLDNLVAQKALVFSQKLLLPELVELRKKLQDLYPQKLAMRDLASAQAAIAHELERVELALKQATQIFAEQKAQAVRKEAMLKDYLQLREKKLELLPNKNTVKAEFANLQSTKSGLALELASIEVQHQEALKNYGSVKQQLVQIKTLEEGLSSQQAEIARLKQEIDDFQTLAQAFGKNGIQALIIESAIPEIENEANRILADLSDEQAMIFIEPLKDLKKGGYKESLDIKISDSAGIRPYEMFSGGEAFRIDFALRISISKLLARRTGASLQTLIIDEGFGSQDQEGIARLMEAIYSVRRDFSKIIVVSHLQEMKDNFPVHFNVSKNLNGSSVSVELRG